MTQVAGLRAYDPAEPCPKCLNEEIGVTFHKSQIYDKIDHSLPCAQLSVGSIGEHLCLKCLRCGYAWIRAAADAKAYDAKTSATQEEDMVIRKTGSAADQAVVGIEGEQENDLTRLRDKYVQEFKERETPEQPGHGDFYEEE
jgi:hypothetical protein